MLKRTIASNSDWLTLPFLPGEAFGFGMGTNNQLAQGDDEDRWEPARLAGKQLENKKVVAIQAGGQHTIMLATSKW